MSESKSYGTMTGEDVNPAPAYFSDIEQGEEGEPKLPTYDETQNEAAPPTYESIFGEIRAAQENSSGRGQFLKKVCSILINTIGFTILIFVLLALPIAMIVVGAVNLDRCPLQRYIPIWLIVGGAVGAFLQLVSIFKQIKNKCEGIENDNQEDSKAYNSCSGVLGCFNVAWFIVGNVWVYRYYPPNTTDVMKDNYCNGATYYLAFWIITSIYIVMFLLCCCSCCVAMVVGGKSSSTTNN